MHYVYHPDHEAKVVDTQTYYKLLEDGWYDSPAKFPSAKTEQGLAAIVEEVEAPKEVLEVTEEEKQIEKEVKKKGRPKKEE